MPAAADEGLADHGGTTPTEGAAADLPPEELQSRAIEDCQAAAELAGRGEIAAAIQRIDHAYALMLALPADEEHEQARQDIRLLAAQVINDVYHARPAGATATVTADSDLGLPMVDNEHVRFEIKSFTTVERDQLIEGYRRSGRYRTMIVRKLEEAGLPRQLSWLPLVESAFKVSALSRASALGLWQFIASTGLRYGLRRDGFIDERLDPEKATDAAIRYLSDLHRQFGDWPKALAAYNCGENAIVRVQGRAANQYQDFWDLYGQLPPETRRYVPRLIAVLQIVEDPARYGVVLPELDPPLTDIKTVAVQRAVKLDLLDAALDLRAGTLVELNPELRDKATPKTEYALRVPAACDKDIGQVIQTVPEYEPPKIEYVVHYVRSGESLSTIAARYHTSVSLIMNNNNLRSAHRIWPGQRLRIPVRR